MPIKMSLEEKCYLIALFGDIPESSRVPLFKVSAYPALAGPVVMDEGRRFVARMEAEKNSLFSVIVTSGGNPAVHGGEETR